MGQEFNIVIVPENFENGIRAVELDEILKILIKNKVIGEQDSCSIGVKKGEHKRVSVSEAIVQYKQMGDTIINELGIAFGTQIAPEFLGILKKKMSDTIVHELSRIHDRKFEPELYDSLFGCWGISIGKQDFYDPHGLYQFTAYVQIFFEFVPGTVFMDEYLQELMKEQKIKDLIEDLSTILKKKVEIKGHVSY